MKSSSKKQHISKKYKNDIKYYKGPSIKWNILMKKDLSQ